MNTRNQIRIARFTSSFVTIALLAVTFFALLNGGGLFGVSANPVIRFTRIPPRGGGEDRLETIAGVVSGVNSKECDCRIVIYAQTDRYYVQPFVDAPYTELGEDNSFEAEIHLGSRYHALLVKKSFRAAPTLNALPSVGGEVLAVASVKADAEPKKAAQEPQPTRSVKFAGRDWKVKASGDRAVGPGPNLFSDHEENVRVDAEGKLRLRITYREGKWQCAEVILAEDHGYGTYRFTLDTPPRSVARAFNAVLGAFTWNTEDAAHNHCEIDFELSSWARRGNKLGQFVIQPYTKPENIVRFDVPETLAPTTHVFRWKPERVECESFKGSGGKQRSFFRHTFTQGIPPETKSTNMRFNLWLFSGKPPADGKELEVVISHFDFRPLG